MPRKNLPIILYILIISVALIFVSKSQIQAHAAEIIIPITQDTYAEQNYPYTSPWNNKNFYVGNDHYYNKGYAISYLNAELYAIDKLMPQDLEAATLQLFMYDYEGSANFTLTAYSPQQSWDQYSLNWHNQPSSQYLISQTQLRPTPGWKSIDITPQVSNYLDNRENNGFKIKMADMNNPAAIFWSTACQYAPTPPSCSPYLGPYIKINYTPNTPPSQFPLIYPEDNFHTNERRQTFTSRSTTDPNGEEVKYFLEVANDSNFDSIIYKSEPQEVTRFLWAMDAPGRKYWRVGAEDEHGAPTGITYSDIRSIIYDTKPPSPPEILPEPPYSIGSSNEIAWLKSQDDYSSENDLSYSCQMAQDNNFTNILQETSWTKDLNTTFENLKDNHTYFYRVFAMDRAGNVSNASETVKSTQDNGNPNIKEFEIIPTYISPDNITSPNQNDYAKISAKVTDATLKNTEIIITNLSHQEILRTGIQSVDAVNWPTNQHPPEGKYYAYIEATDEFQNKSRTKSETIIVDNTSPNPPVFLCPLQNHYYNTKDIIPNVTYDSDTTLTMRTKDIPYSLHQRPEYPQNPLLYLREGQNTIIAISSDLAKNRSESQVTFVIDTIPPVKPEVSAKIDTSSKNIRLTIQGEPQTTTHILVNGTKTEAFKLHQPRHQVDIVKGYKSNTVYSIFVYLEDRAGNKSPNSEVLEIKTPADPTVGVGSGFENSKEFHPTPKAAACIVSVHKDKNQYSVDRCKIPQPRISEVQHKFNNDPNVFDIDLYGSVQEKIQLRVNHYRCKAKSFFDPRTWFMCVDEKYNKSKRIMYVKTVFFPKSSLIVAELMNILKQST